MTHTIITPTAAERVAVARLVARYFLVHLHAEGEKPDAVLLEDYPHLPVRRMIQEWIARVRDEFAVAEAEPLPEYNLIEEWCELNGKFHYFDSAFVGYNPTYIERLIDLREGTSQSAQRHRAAMQTTFRNLNYEKQGFTVPFFLNSEGMMRELLREIVRRDLPEMAEAGDEIILAQSRRIQTDMYEYFEGILKTTLEENVRLLHGILPQQVASQLKRNGHVEPVLFPDAAVLFTDFEKFSESTAHRAPAEVIHQLDLYFSEFDRISEDYGLEKIKTIGDSYMAVAGVPEPHPEPVRAACDAALEILEASNRLSNSAGWPIRIGVHAGPLVAGVIGRQKFSYDVWGATVNFASRMESSGEPGRINVSADVHARVEPDYRWEPRGPLPVKRLGLAEMFFLVGKK